MSAIVLRVLGQDISVESAPENERRLTDLAASLQARLPDFTADAVGVERLILVALSLMDEAQTAGAALARAHQEIDRLTDLLPDVAHQELVISV
jgi:cell division protein ZapA (FtsZ GTPase activity inhibitor)